MKIHTTDLAVGDLLKDGKTYAVPPFQRNYSWEKELQVSDFWNDLIYISENKEGDYFIGSMVFTPHAHKGKVTILDGQQRLTSLYQALYGVGRYRFYIKLGALVEQASNIDEKLPLFQELDIEESLFHETLRIRRDKIIGKDDINIEKQAEELIFPVSQVFKSGGYEKWRDEVVEIRKKKGIYQDSDNEILRRIGKELIVNLENYEFPLITLQRDIPTEAVCTIFETLNRTGIKLSVYDLLVARFYPEDIKLRDDWIEAQANFPIIREFGIDPYYLLQVIAIRCDRRGMGECKRGVVLKLVADDYRKYWKSTVEAFGEGLTILRDNCGVLAPSWLPYATFLIPFVAVISETKEHFHGPTIAGWKSKLQRWFWASTFAQLYESSPNSISKEHFIDVKMWIEKDTTPVFLSTAQEKLQSIDPIEITPRQRAQYRGFMCLLLKRGIRDFYKADPINASKILSGEVNDHHIFPKSIFGKGELTNIIDSIPNRTLIDERSNKIIRASEPSNYIPILKTQFQGREFNELFEQHLIPIISDSPIWKNDAESFINQRSEAIVREARQILGENG